MARILSSLPGSTWSEDFTVGRTAKDDKSMTKLAHQIVAQRLTQQVRSNIEAKDLIDTGAMQDGSSITYVGGANKRFQYDGPVHAAYQEHGTTVLAPTHFIAEVMKSGRADWEADVRETKANLERQAEAAEKKEKGNRHR